MQLLPSVRNGVSYIPRIGISLMPDVGFAQATAPLFESGDIECVEWSFDTLWNSPRVPMWLTDVLNHYASLGRLLGHGVYFSLFSGVWSEHHKKWVDILRQETALRNYQLISEHFGYMLTSDGAWGAPMPVPYSRPVFHLAQKRLELLRSVSGTPVGLENMAFSFCRRQAMGQGKFISKIIRSTGGFVLLDLHNLFCQMMNFGFTEDQALNTFDLSLVQEIHLSGGSRSKSPFGKWVRRDTHDGAVPRALESLLKKALRRCPNLRWIVLERLGRSLHDRKQQHRFRDEFLKIKQWARGH